MVYDDRASEHWIEQEHVSARHKREAHCGKANCFCTHTGRCFKGWFDNDEGTAVPCPNCRGPLVEALARVGAPGFREPGDLHREVTRGQVDSP